MPFFPSLAPPARASLTERLDRLRQDLHFLGGRLREGLARVVGEAVAGATRDAVRALLGGNDSFPEEHASQCRPPPYQGAAPLWGGPRGMAHTPWRDDRLDDPEWYPPYEGDGEEGEYSEPAAPPPGGEGPRQVRWGQALATGLQAAAWCLRRRTGRFALLLALGAGLASTLAVYLGGTFALTGTGLVGSALALLTLARPAPSTTPGPLDS